jgi:Tubulin binding cofactor C
MFRDRSNSCVGETNAVWIILTHCEMFFFLFLYVGSPCPTPTVHTHGYNKYRDKPLEALHLVELDHTTLTLSTRVASSIHVTHCQDCDIQGPVCQQIRIHESTHLRFTLGESMIVAGGAILENSKDIVFVVRSHNHHDTTATARMDVKDFSWLHAGVPSPNFRMEESTATDDDDGGVGAKMEGRRNHDPIVDNDAAATRTVHGRSTTFMDLPHGRPVLYPVSQTNTDIPRTNMNHNDECSEDVDGDDDDEL